LASAQEEIMKLAKLFPLFALAACTDGPSKQESIYIFAAAQTAMSNAQSEAVAEADMPFAAPAETTLDYSGPCSLGGTISLTGSYSDDSVDGADADRAAFDLTTSFNGCAEVTGTLDGSLQWTSVADDAGWTATMKGGLVWRGQDGDASCDFDLSMLVSDTVISYGGHLCGYDVGAELVLDGNARS
jgi:hypothetical protein